MKQVRVLIVDDHLVVRIGVKMLLDTEPYIKIVGEAKDADSAVQLNKQLQPNIILMDLMLPGKNGLEAIAEIKCDNPGVKVIVLTSFEDEEKIQAAMSTSVDGYLLKNADGEELLQAIRAVQEGNMPVHPRVARYLFTTQQRTSTNGLYLTERETEIVQLIAQGLSNKELAHRLNLTEGTVKSYVSQILTKLKVSTRTEAALWAAKKGLIKIE